MVINPRFLADPYSKKRMMAAPEDEEDEELFPAM
jgi:hypothetical protein